jgi:23S rRNA U2552 (ribose-2'-O)-methylase RlmE/FtsJ
LTRVQGWKNPEGDKFFAKQRAVADSGSPEMAILFYKMMQNIGRELHDSTGAFTIRSSQGNPPNFLDLCMAPGGFLGIAMQLNPHSTAIAYSLPVANGGHKILLPTNSSVRIKLLDVTLLAADLGVEEIPKDHPDRRNFLPREFSNERVFDAVLCDGQVLRTHARASYRENREARRLTVTQLALGLEHIKSGGTMIVLLHKVEAMDTVELLHRFNCFSTVRLFKPSKNHGKRSSFYMVATNIQSGHPEVAMAISQWKRMWEVATFGSADEYESQLRENSSRAQDILVDFGPELVRMGKDIWDIQARALSKAPFVAKKSVHSCAVR